METCPFWSAMLLGSLKRYSLPSSPKNALLYSEVKVRTQGPIESHFTVLNRIEFNGKKHLRADEFVNEQYQYLDKRLILFSEESMNVSKTKGKRGTKGKHTKKKGQRKSKTMKWLKKCGTRNRKRMTKKGHFQKPPKQKFLSSVSLEDIKKQKNKQITGYQLFFAQRGGNIPKQKMKKDIFQRNRKSMERTFTRRANGMEQQSQIGKRKASKRGRNDTYDTENVRARPKPTKNAGM